jgi:7,8-dihydroneopterin aldolase/epimerase/oxygenase
MDTLHINNVLLFGHTGYFPEERKLGVHFRLDLALGLDIAQAAQQDDLQQTVDYSEILQEIQGLVEQAHYLLLERLAEKIAAVILTRHRCAWVRVILTKPHPPLPYGACSVAIEILRDQTWATAQHDT